MRKVAETGRAQVVCDAVLFAPTATGFILALRSVGMDAYVKMPKDAAKVLLEKMKETIGAVAPLGDSAGE